MGVMGKLTRLQGGMTGVTALELCRHRHMSVMTAETVNRSAGNTLADGILYSLNRTQVTTDTVGEMGICNNIVRVMAISAVTCNIYHVVGMGWYRISLVEDRHVR